MKTTHFVLFVRRLAGTQCHKDIFQRRVGFDLPADFHSADIRQPHIQQHQIGGISARQEKPVLAGRRLQHLVAGFAQAD